ncbi:FkbM family methyltransferase [Synechococcus sp. CBW1107]|uniref:FkbM family methyltransferase n=1 Tax=Synechococcus sp. CBW1107 TaxID=2789857 RepID=UPI002AD27DFE|nr:FkbM family methyltransferase [Synechococcus sp. CBW1107]CAK6696093.1 hypothetical protein ICNINCKA_01956 [Synechococcus sp. CBW1107]
MSPPPASDPYWVDPVLVFDLGFHRGEDTAYYLALGRRVIAVEANPELVAEGHRRFAVEIAASRLVLLHAAVVGEHQRREQSVVAFFPHPSHSEWGSVDPRWVERNATVHGLPHAPSVEVPCVSLPLLVERHGTPSFLKIDIEGVDTEVLRDLALLSVRPATLSWETGKESWRAVLRQHRQLRRLGYRRFRVVQQACQHRLQPAALPDGTLWPFPPGCSGPLPQLSETAWRSIGWVLLQYTLLFGWYGLVGPRSWFARASRSRRPWLHRIPRAVQAWARQRDLPLPGWYDSHARLD